MKTKIEERIKEIEEEIGNDVLEENIRDVVDTLKVLGGEEHSLGGTERKQIWKLLKDKYPKILPAVPVGKKDRSGNIITNHIGLRKLYLDTYIHRLRNRPIQSDFEEIMKMKTELFDLRLKLSESRKSIPWEMKDLDKVLSALKTDKA